MNERSNLASTRRWVIKVGSALLTDDGEGLDQALIDAWCAQIHQLRDSGLEVLLVSSGSVAAGVARLGWSRRPAEMHHLQAAAAVGQAELVKTYEIALGRHDIRCAQVLLTHADLADRQRYLNARSTLLTLLDMGVVPVINENDTVATEEIRFGDNDNLAALVANLVDADLLVILTDQNGLFTADPRTAPNAELIADAEAGDPGLLQMAGEVTTLGRGGMRTKLSAAEKAARSGTHTLIANGRGEDILLRLYRGEPQGSLLRATTSRLTARKQWLAGQMRAQGSLVLDTGAVKVLCEAGRSLLPVGVTEVRGDFSRGELVSCLDPEGREIARGLSNYGAEDTRRIMGQPSERIAEILTYAGEPELIHRDNLVVL